MGDVVLREIASRLSAVCRSADSIFRMGGEEFLVLSPETGLKQALKLGERLRRSVEARRMLLTAPGGEPVERLVTVTVGVSAWRPAATLHELIAEADRAMYEGKQSGRNQVRATQRTGH